MSARVFLSKYVVEYTIVGTFDFVPLDDKKALAKQDTAEKGKGIAAAPEWYLLIWAITHPIYPHIDG